MKAHFVETSKGRYREGADGHRTECGRFVLTQGTPLAFGKLCGDRFDPGVLFWVEMPNRCSTCERIVKRWGNP